MIRLKDLQQAAQDRGDRVFNTGKPCIRGHMADRYSSNMTCTVCALQFAQTHRKNNLKLYAERQMERRDKDREKQRKYDREYRSKYWKTENGRKRILAADRKWGKKNRDRIREEDATK